MQKKINLTICTGTACYVMGGAELLSIGDKLDNVMNEYVCVTGSPCLDCCRDGKSGKPPFVEIDGKIMPEATTGKIIEYLKTLLPK